jgi:hypothetical protein
MPDASTEVSRIIAQDPAYRPTPGLLTAATAQEGSTAQHPSSPDATRQ